MRKAVIIVLIAGCIGCALWLLLSSRDRLSEPDRAATNVDEDEKETDSSTGAPKREENAKTGESELKQMFYTPPDYREAATKVLLAEANQIIKDLDLDGSRPITESDLRETVIHSPYMASRAQMFGVVKTDKYLFSAAISNKLSFIMPAYSSPDGYNKDLDALLAKGALPKSAVDTNAAASLARTWLRKARMDVGALDRDGKLEVRFWNMGSKFVPIYHVSWVKDGDSIASVEFYEPTRTLRKLRVEKDKYNHRNPIPVPQIDASAAIVAH